MKIAFFCDAYKPTRSGVAVSVDTTAQELRARGHQVTIFAPRYKGHNEDEPDVTRFPAFHWFRARDFPVAYPLLPRASLFAGVRFRREQFDIVHSHSPFTIGVLGARWARSNRIPIVFTFHTLYHRYLHYVPAPRAWTRSYVVWWVRHYCYLCSHIIAPSRPVAQIVSHLQPRVPCSVLPTGIDIARFSSASPEQREKTRQRLGIAAGETVLLYVGRIVREKNLVFLLRSLAPLLDGKSDAHKVRLVLVGGGPDMEPMRNLAAQLNIAEKVIFTDFVAPSSTLNYYTAADTFVFASRTETQGVSIAEALAAGLPCVVVGAMGAAEAVTDGVDGLIVPPNEEQFRDAVQRLVDSPDLRQGMAQAARLKAPLLSREHCVDELLQLYCNLIPAEK